MRVERLVESFGTNLNEIVLIYKFFMRPAFCIKTVLLCHITQMRLFQNKKKKQKKMRLKVEAKTKILTRVYPSGHVKFLFSTVYKRSPPPN